MSTFTHLSPRIALLLHLVTKMNSDDSLTDSCHSLVQLQVALGRLVRKSCPACFETSLLLVKHCDLVVTPNMYSLRCQGASQLLPDEVLVVEIRYRDSKVVKR